MNKRDDFFYQAVLYAKEKNYPAARAMLRNLLFQYPDDIEGLLLYSIVAKNREGSIQALKRILLIDPDHEIAFNKLVKLKQAAPDAIPTPTAPLPIPPPKPTPRPVPVQQSPTRPAATPSMLKTRTHPAHRPQETISSQNIQMQDAPVIEKKKKKRNYFDWIVFGLFIFMCLCLSLAVLQKIVTALLTNL